VIFALDLQPWDSFLWYFLNMGLCCTNRVEENMLGGGVVVSGQQISILFLPLPFVFGLLYLESDVCVWTCYFHTQPVNCGAVWEDPPTFI
jgi:hypothetical protein